MSFTLERFASFTLFSNFRNSCFFYCACEFMLEGGTRTTFLLLFPSAEYVECNQFESNILSRSKENIFCEHKQQTEQHTQLIYLISPTTTKCEILFYRYLIIPFFLCALNVERLRSEMSKKRKILFADIVHLARNHISIAQKLLMRKLGMMMTMMKTARR